MSMKCPNLLWWVLEGRCWEAIAAGGVNYAWILKLKSQQSASLGFCNFSLMQTLSFSSILGRSRGDILTVPENSHVPAHVLNLEPLRQTHIKEWRCTEEAEDATVDVTLHHQIFGQFVAFMSQSQVHYDKARESTPFPVPKQQPGPKCGKDSYLYQFSS
jgi:hypothetical protein